MNVTSIAVTQDFVMERHILHGLDLSLLPIFNDVPSDLLKCITPEMLRFYGDGNIMLAGGIFAFIAQTLLDDDNEALARIIDEAEVGGNVIS